jgi:tRNA threonylcarbamoyladenosine biosynthesis protein TsaB
VHSLFVDSTSGLTIGLLDSNYSWVEYMSLDEKKPSEIIHFEIFNLLKKHNLKLANMQCFVSSGPGSYTGMRLSEGLAQVFELNHMPVYSFYHFDIPRFSGITEGFWITNAFKGQLFVYQWKGDQVEKQLINKDAFVIENQKMGFTLDLNDPLFLNLVSTKNLLKDKASEIFSKISSQKLREAPYYFRPLDEEFR